MWHDRQHLTSGDPELNGKLLGRWALLFSVESPRNEQRERGRRHLTEFSSLLYMCSDLCFAYFRWNMTSKYVNSNDPNEKCLSSAVSNRLASTSHHVRHHSYDTTSSKLAAQLFPSSRSNRKENQLNNNNSNTTAVSNGNGNTNAHQGHFLPTRSSHRHTSSYASDQSSFTNLNSNHYHQHNYSASQENLRRKFDLSQERERESDWWHRWRWEKSQTSDDVNINVSNPFSSERESWGEDFVASLA